MSTAKSRTRQAKYKRKSDKEEFATNRLVDDIDKFMDFKANVLPALRKDIEGGMCAEELRKKYSALMTARMISIGLTSEDSRSALSAIKDVIDRTEGRAKERSEVTHKLEKLNDTELDSLLNSEFKELKQLEGAKGDVH